MFLALLLAVAIDPRVHALFERADALDAAHDPAGAVQAYIDAVKIDPSADDLDRLLRYGLAYIRSDADLPKEKLVEPLMTSALQDYLSRHPNTLRAIERLAPLLPPAEGEKLVDDYLRTDPHNVRACHARSAPHYANGLYEESLADLQRIANFEPKVAEHRVAIEYVNYSIAGKMQDAAKKRDHIARGLAAGRQAMELDPSNYTAVAMASLLVREEAKLESDPAKKGKLTSEADAYKAHADELLKARRRP